MDRLSREKVAQVIETQGLLGRVEDALELVRASRPELVREVEETATRLEALMREVVRLGMGERQP